MSDKTGLYIFIIVFVVAAILILYFILFDAGFYYPASPFTKGQTVVISPAVLSDINIPNQYLTFLNPTDGASCYNFIQSGTADFGWDMSDNDCVATFTGTDSIKSSNQWVLMETTSSGDNSTDQSLQSGYGNRYYLKNSAYADNDIKGRLRYEGFSIKGATLAAMCPSSTSVVAGGTCTSNYCAYYEELIIYFLPTQYPDLYYLLFPSVPLALSTSTANTIQNNGIISARPWSAPNNSNWSSNHNFCENTDAYFTPYCLDYESKCTDKINNLNYNSMLINKLDEVDAVPPLNNYPNVYLFRVTGIDTTSK